MHYRTLSVIALAVSTTLAGCNCGKGVTGKSDGGDSGFPTPTGPSVYWYPSCNFGVDGNAYGYLASALNADAGGVLPAPYSTAAVDGGCSTAVAFDPAGHLWDVDSRGGKIWGFALQRDGGASVLAVLTPLPDGGGIAQPQAIAFATNGDLYEIDMFGSRLAHFTGSSIQSSGSPTPAELITRPTITDGGYSYLNLPAALAFDPAGNLWVANAFSKTVSEFSTGPLTPRTIIWDNAGANDYFAGLSGLAFDPAGNLWTVSSSAGFFGGPIDMVSKFSVAGLSGNVASNPSVILTSSAGAPPAPVDPFNGTSGVTFDQLGNMWSLNSGAGDLDMVADGGNINGYPDGGLVQTGTALMLGPVVPYVPSQSQFYPAFSGSPLNW